MHLQGSRIPSLQSPPGRWDSVDDCWGKREYEAGGKLLNLFQVFNMMYPIERKQKDSLDNIYQK